MKEYKLAVFLFTVAIAGFQAQLNNCLIVVIRLHLSVNCEDHLGTADDFTASFLHFSLFSTAFWDLANSRPVHSLMLSSHLFFCLPCLLPAFTVAL